MRRLADGGHFIRVNSFEAIERQRSQLDLVARKVTGRVILHMWEMINIAHFCLKNIMRLDSQNETWLFYVET